VPPRFAAVRAPDLGRDRALNLLGDHRVLYRDQQVLGFEELQTQRVRGQAVAVHGEHFPDHGRAFAVIIGVHNHLHAQLHPPTSWAVGAAPAARVLLQARRSKRSRPNNGIRLASSSQYSPRTTATMSSSSASSSRPIISPARDDRGEH
jgi:hypothetical protein